MRRLNIAVMVLDLSGEYTIEIFAGISEFFKDKNVNVLLTQTKMPDVPYGFSEYQYFAGTRLFQSQDIDGIIVVSNFFTSTCPGDKFASYFSDFSEKPIVSIGHELPFENSLFTDTDCEETYRKIFDHIVNKHGHNKIAFLSANRTISQEAKARFEAYKKITAEFGFPYREDFVFSGNFTVASGEGEMSSFTKPEDVPFDAIICANDQMAFGAMAHLTKIGVRIPEDVIVFGFDDLYKSSQITPTLSTINQEIFAQGYKAAELVYQKLLGNPTQKRNKVPLKAVFRQSCGCVDHDDSETDHIDLSGNILKKADLITTSTIQKYIQKDDERNKIYDCLDAMQNTTSLDDLFTKLDIILPSISLKRIALCLYSEPVVVNKGDLMELPDTVHCAYVFDGTRGVTRVQDVVINPYEHLIPSESYPENPSQYVLQAIFFGDKQYGYGFFEFADINYLLANIYLKILSNGIANSFEYSKKLNEAKNLSQKNIQLETSINLLDTKSRTDELTHILNRRGFMNAGTQALQFSSSMEKTGIVVFCDMDGLKKINDTYGHEIGDRAIQAEAQALKDSFRASDVVGRLSGDEFAIVAIGQKIENFDRIYQKIQANCKKQSAAFGLPCEISISVGAIPFDRKDLNLQVLLSKADVEQYKEKHRKHAERKN